MSTPSNRASNPAGKSPKRKDVTLDLTTARQMLPLVRGIVADIVDTQRLLARLNREQELLEDTRLKLDWNGRQRRYAIAEEIARTEQNLTATMSELTALGLKLVEPTAGSVDFPTRINGRPAAFAWQPGDDSVAFWHYNGEDHRRPIPSDWQAATPIRYRAEP